jgi:hypothetical protein
MYIAAPLFIAVFFLNVFDSPRNVPSLKYTPPPLQVAKLDSNNTEEKYRVGCPR